MIVAYAGELMNRCNDPARLALGWRREFKDCTGPGGTPRLRGPVEVSLRVLNETRKWVGAVREG